MSETLLPLVEVELGVVLAAYATGTGGAALERRLEQDLAALAARLGLPGKPRVGLRATESERAVRICVDGRIRPYPLTVFRRAWLAVAPDELSGVPLDAAATEPGVYPDVWLAGIADADDPTLRGTVVAYLARLVLETVARRPASLLSGAVAEAFFEGEERTIDATAEERIEVLGRLLNLGVELRPREAVQRVVRGCFASAGDVYDAVEEVFVRLARERIEVRVHPSYLAQLGVQPDDAPLGITDERLPEELREAGGVVADHLLELGVVRPITLIADERVRVDQAEIRINDHVGLPIPIARPGEMVAHAAPWKVHGEHTRVLIDAASGHRLTAIPAGAEGGSSTTFDFATTSAAAFLPVAVAREVSPLAYRLITVEDVERELASYAEGSRALVYAALQRVRLAQLTSLIRSLVRDRVSGRDLSSLLNALLRSEHALLAGPDRAIEFVRRELAPRVTLDSIADVKGGQLDAFETDEALERLATAQADGDDGESIRDIIRTTLLRRRVPADAVILTDDAARQALRDLLAPEFPSIYVLARSEVPKHVRIRRMAWITGAR